MGVSLLTVDKIIAGYGKMDILHGVSLHVQEGEIVSVIGPNGAGKSTVFKTIMGYLTPRQGRVSFDGHDITGLRTDQIMRHGLCYVPQGRIVFPLMTVQENLDMGAYTERNKARFRAALARVYDFFPILAERRHQKAGTLSGGEQQMLAIGRALMIAPKLLLLDEPSLGLSPKFVTLIFETVQRLRSTGITQLIVEQNAARALEVAHRGYVLELGRNRFEDTGRNLLSNPEVKQLYLGG